MTEPMSDLDLLQIKVRAESVAAGPWEVSPRSPSMDGDWWTLRVQGQPGERARIFDRRVLGDLPAFIAHARTDVPALLAEVGRLRVEVEELRAGTPEITDEMVERAAVGICTTVDLKPTWEELDEDWRDFFRGDARAALTAALGGEDA